MSDHKFEKQVRQKLGDLKLTPSTESWEKIEKEIRARKRRRIPVFWLPLLLLGLGAGGYFMLKPSHDGNGLIAVAENEKSETKATTPDNKNITGEEKIISPEFTKPGSPQSEVAEATQLVLKKERRNSATRILSSQIETDTKEEYPNILRNNKAVIAGQEPSQQKESLQQQNVAQQVQPVTNSTEPSTDESNKVPTGQPKKLIAHETTSTQEPAKPSEQKKADRSDNKKKWSFGVTGSAGVSAISEGKFVSFSGAQVEDVRATPDLSGNFVGSPMVTAPPPPPPPSKLEPSFSYSVGVTAKRELSKRFALSASVSYLQMNTVTRVGYQMNNRQIVNNDLGYNVVDLYYLPSQDYINKYKNRYHFLEIPVTLHTRLNKSKTLPVYWNAGVSANILLASNALHYDGNTGVYYKDEALLNQVQGGVSTGFSFSLFNKSKTPLWIGPTARYNFSPVLKRSVSTNKNLMGLGLDLRWYLK